MVAFTPKDSDDKNSTECQCKLEANAACNLDIDFGPRQPRSVWAFFDKVRYSATFVSLDCYGIGSEFSMGPNDFGVKSNFFNPLFCITSSK